MRIDVLTVFPEMIEGPLSSSMVGIARSSGALDLRGRDLREWALPGVHRQVDDAPYGGGPGMVMRPEPVYAAVREIAAEGPAPIVVLLTPQGRRLDQQLVEELAAAERLLLVCGRYEGFDERIRSLADLEVSIGDYVLTGGEIPAMVVVDSVSRLLPGVLGGEGSVEEESFSWGLLEYPQYTRPPQFEGMTVPEVLVSGDHARIRRWRRLEAVRKTALCRPDLLDGADLTEEEREFAERVLATGPSAAEEE